jgi:hypothetical protein
MLVDKIFKTLVESAFTCMLKFLRLPNFFKVEAISFTNKSRSLSNEMFNLMQKLNHQDYSKRTQIQHFTNKMARMYILSKLFDI